MKRNQMVLIINAEIIPKAIPSLEIVRVNRRGKAIAPAIGVNATNLFNILNKVK